MRFWRVVPWVQQKSCCGSSGHGAHEALDSAKVDLSGLAGIGGRPHGQIGEWKILGDVSHEAVDGRVAVMQLVLVHEDGVHGFALHTRGHPACDGLTPGLGLGDVPGGALGLEAQTLGDG
jgi:hypothetical protein